MSGHELEDEFQEMFEQGSRSSKVLSNVTIQQPISILDLAPAATVDITAGVDEAIALMQEKEIGCVLVVRAGLLAGIFTERDVLMKLLSTKGESAKIPVSEVMTSSPETLHTDDTIAYAMNLMSVGGYRHVPIVDANGKPLSILSVKDVVSYIVEHFPDEVLNLPPKPLRSTSAREGA